MKSIATVLFALLIAPQGAVTGKVESSFDKKANFQGFRSYSWSAGYHAFNPDAHKMLVTAIEAQMASLGFAKVTTGPDVTLAYYTVTGADVDLKALDRLERQGGGGGPAPTKARARLVVVMRQAASNQQAWSASTREYLDPDPAKLNDTIESVVARLFDTYPRPKPAR